MIDFAKEVLINLEVVFGSKKIINNYREEPCLKMAMDQLIEQLNNIFESSQILFISEFTSSDDFLAKI